MNKESLMRLNKLSLVNIILKEQEKTYKIIDYIEKHIVMFKEGNILADMDIDEIYDILKGGE